MVSSGFSIYYAWMLQVELCLHFIPDVFELQVPQQQQELNVRPDQERALQRVQHRQRQQGGGPHALHFYLACDSEV